jgi:hypothetical protein
MLLLARAYAPDIYTEYIIIQKIKFVNATGKLPEKNSAQFEKNCKNPLQSAP